MQLDIHTGSFQYATCDSGVLLFLPYHSPLSVCSEVGMHRPTVCIYIFMRDGFHCCACMVHM